MDTHIRYALKRSDGMYLMSGNMWFKFTKDIYKAKDFKTPENAKKWRDIINEESDKNDLGLDSQWPHLENYTKENAKVKVVELMTLEKEV